MTTTHLLEMIEAHHGIEIRGGHVWVGGGAAGTAAEWEQAKAAASIIDRLGTVLDIDAMLAKVDAGAYNDPSFT